MTTSLTIASTTTPADLAPIAERIRGNMQKTTTAILEIGRDLLQAREIVDHGAFREWVEASTGLTIRTAQNYMNAAAWAGDKSETVSLLQPSTVYALAAPSTSPEIREEVVSKLEAGETIDARDVEIRARLSRMPTQQPRHRRRRKISAEARRCREREDKALHARWQREEDEAKAACAEMVDILGGLPAPVLARFRHLLDVRNAATRLVETFGERATP